MILVVNIGSTSYKFKIFNPNFEVKIAGSYSNIGDKISNHQIAANMMLKEIKDTISEIKKVGYRIVHGGDKGDEIMPITLPTMKIIESFADLAPQHNPAAEQVIRFLIEKIPLSDHFAAFDTAFFRQLPDVSKIYPIDKNLAEKFEIKRFGFHGISHQYMVSQVDPENEKKVVTIHLGAGSSIAAILKGRPIDTSMGFTPLEGLPMQARSGDIDPGIILFLVEKIGSKKTKEMIENNSGLAGISDTSGDMIGLLKLAGEKIEIDETELKSSRFLAGDNDLAKLAIEIYCQRIKKYLGAYIAILGGVDLIVFSGEIGYGSSVIREKILSGLNFVKFKTEIIKPDEELAIAKKL